MNELYNCLLGKYFWFNVECLDDLLMKVLWKIE